MSLEIGFCLEVVKHRQSRDNMNSSRSSMLYSVPQFPGVSSCCLHENSMSSKDPVDLYRNTSEEKELHRVLKTNTDCYANIETELLFNKQIVI